MDDIKKEFLLEVHRMRNEGGEAPSEYLQIRNIVRYLQAYGFDPQNVVCSFLDERKIILVPDLEGRLPSFEGKFDIYPSVRVFDMDSINEEAIYDVCGVSTDFLRDPLTEKEKEERIGIILEEIEKHYFLGDLDEYSGEIWSETLTDRNKAIELLENTAKVFQERLATNAFIANGTDRGDYEQQYTKVQNAIDELKKCDAQYVILGKTMRFFDEWTHFFRQKLEGKTLCEAFQEFLKITLKGSDEYWYYKNYHLLHNVAV